MGREKRSKASINAWPNARPESIKAGVSEVQRLREIMARLRGPSGCPWDHEQTHASLAPYLIEECCELLETIDHEDHAHMQEELGDVLLQVVFHAQLAEEAGHFNLESVARGISDKLVRRHPHVFGEHRLETSGEVLHQWDKIKRAEKGMPDHELEPFVKPSPGMLPALLRAVDAYKQLARKRVLPTGTSEMDAAAIEKTAAGLDEAAAGRMLFELAAACRRAGIDPESALRRHISRVIDAAVREHSPARRP